MATLATGTVGDEATDWASSPTRVDQMIASLPRWANEWVSQPPSPADRPQTVTNEPKAAHP